MTILFRPTDLPIEAEVLAPSDAGTKTTATKDIWPFDWLPFGMEY